jgi:hypothetical protein
MFLGYHVEGDNATTFVGDRLAPEPDVAIYTQEPSRNVLIVTSKPPCVAGAENLRISLPLPRGLGAPWGWVFFYFKGLFKVLGAPKPLEPTGLPPCWGVFGGKNMALRMLTIE